MSPPGSAGSAIRVLRETQNLSLRGLARLSGTSASYLGEVERGEKTPTDRWMRAVQAALAQNLERVSA